MKRFIQSITSKRKDEQASNTDSTGAAFPFDATTIITRVDNRATHTTKKEHRRQSHIKEMLDYSGSQIELKSQVDRMVMHSGRKTFLSHLKFYARSQIPTAIASVWMFAMYAALSWFIPNKMCKETIEELSGSSLGLSSCVYATDGAYRPYSSTKIFWLVYWSFQAAWMALFPGFVCKIIFGKNMSRFQGITTLIIGASCMAVPIVTALRYGMALNNYIVLSTSALGSFLVVLICGSAAARYTNNALNKWRFITLFMFAGQVNTLYLFIMPLIITNQSQQAFGGMGLTIVRVFVHPIVWSVVLFFFRTFQRHIGRVKNLAQIGFIIWPYLYSSLYGRFLLLQLDSVGSVIVLNFMFACFGIAGALIDRGSDAGWLSVVYGDRAKDAIQATKLCDEIEFVNALTGNMMEVASIVSTSAVLSIGSVTTIPGVPPNSSAIWFNAFIQWITTILFDFAQSVACAKFHNLEWEKVYPKSTRRFLLYILTVLTIGGSRVCIELLLLYCPKVYDGQGILLDQCDKPSLFQAISDSIGKSRKNVADTAVPLAAQYINGTWIAKTEL